MNDQTQHSIPPSNPGQFGDWDDDDQGWWDDTLHCTTCHGDGIETSDDLMQEDPLWWDGVDSIPCRNCGGSGLRKDQTSF